jgi:hypothetical protein
MMQNGEESTLHWVTIGSLVACSAIFSWLVLVESIDLLSAMVMVISLMVGVATFLFVGAWLCASGEGRSALLAGFLAAVREDLMWLRTRRKR